jgi:hypothetical protein
MMPKNRLQALELGTFDSANLTANFQALYDGGLPHAVSMLRIINKSNVDIIVSYDGATENDYVVTLETLTVPAQLIAQPRNNEASIPAGTNLSVKQATAAGVGNIYVTGYYTGE